MLFGKLISFAKHCWNIELLWETKQKRGPPHSFDDFFKVSFHWKEWKLIREGFQLTLVHHFTFVKTIMKGAGCIFHLANLLFLSKAKINYLLKTWCQVMRRRLSATFSPFWDPLPIFAYAMLCNYHFEHLLYISKQVSSKMLLVWRVDLRKTRGDFCQRKFLFRGTTR